MIKRLPETSLMTIKAMIREHSEVETIAINDVDNYWNDRCKQIYQAPGTTLTVDIYQGTCKISIHDRELMVRSLYDEANKSTNSVFLDSERNCIKGMYDHRKDDMFDAYLNKYVGYIKEFISNMQHVFDKYSLATWIQNHPDNFKKWAVDEDTCEFFRTI